MRRRVLPNYAPAGILPADKFTGTHHQSLRLGTVAFRRLRKAGRPKGEYLCVIDNILCLAKMFG